ncbi:MAG TPA: ABC transporter ATP-binding protein [Marinobacter sp.]|nr:ABC transporter ATP-binding protein [Marinobacter sp.]
MGATATNVLEAQSVSLSYRHKRENKPVLRDFSLQLKAGEVLAVLGFSGSGKSTLLRILAGLRSPDSGKVTIGNKILSGPHPRVGFMFQDPCLLPWLTLEDNVAFGLSFKRQQRISKQEKLERVQSALQEVGLEDSADRYPSALSGGMAQRGALARCLARKPEILLLDEPFSALDAVTRSEMQQLLLSVTKNHGTAAILVTHDIDEALRVADRVLLLGGQPASVAGTWDLTGQSRSTNNPMLVHTRRDIVSALRNGRSDSRCDMPGYLTAVPA